MSAMTVLLKYEQKCYKFLRQIMKTCQSHFVFFLFFIFPHKTCICEYCLNGTYMNFIYIYRRADGQSTPHFVYILTIDSLDICWDTMNVLTDFLCAFCFHFFISGGNFFFVFVVWLNTHNLYMEQIPMF